MLEDQFGKTLLTCLTVSTKCSLYPLATSRQINLILGTIPITSRRRSISFAEVPALIATC